jgi:hypothetical protein
MVLCQFIETTFLFGNPVISQDINRSSKLLTANRERKKEVLARYIACVSI